MPSRRDLIRMTDEEVDAYLHGRHSMAVGSIGKDGRPHLVAMWYGFFDDGAPGFWTFGKSQKVINLRRDPRVTCLVETGDTYDELRGAELIATAVLHEDEESVREIGRSVVQRYYGVTDPEAVESAVTATMKKRVAVRLAVDKVVSWDHSKLGGRY